MLFSFCQIRASNDDFGWRISAMLFLSPKNVNNKRAFEIFGFQENRGDTSPGGRD
jgi:hypothetical protein